MILSFMNKSSFITSGSCIFRFLRLISVVIFDFSSLSIFSLLNKLISCPSLSSCRFSILLAGYCEPNSLGGRLKLRPSNVTIFGEEYQVKAEIAEIKSLSAHADYEDLSQFLACQDPLLVKQFFVVHGEPEVQEHFKRRLIKKGFVEVYIPAPHQSFHV